MKIEQQVISLPLAKRLKELGVQQESICGYNPKGKVHAAGESMAWGKNDSGWVSAFTASETEIMLPKEVNIAYKNGKPREDSHWLKYQRVHNGYRVAYLNSRYSSDSWFEVRGETLAEAFGEMIAYLIENKLMVV